MYTEAMAGYFDISRSTLHMVVYNQTLPEHERQIYLIVILNKVLFRMGMIRMHASAIQLHGRVAAFTGDRGAGKSSITTRLAMAGGLVLADDDVMLRKQNQQFWASGCDETMRLLPDTEAYFYQHLSEPTKTFAGIDKKEICTADRYRSQPYTDYPLDHLFFSSVGKTFSITRLAAREVVLRLMASLIPSNRYAGFSDQASTLDYLMTLATSIPCYELELSPNLQELDRLVDFLEEGVR